MEYVPKHTTEYTFLMVLMVIIEWFLMFVMVFVVETIRIFCDGFIVFFQQSDCADTIGRDLNWMMTSMIHQWTDFIWKNDSLLLSSCIIDKLLSWCIV